MREQTHHPASLPPAAPWLLLAISAIGLSALFAVLLVLSRTPYLQQLFGLERLFHTALVMHVNFSVLIWLLTGAGCLWALQRPYHLPWLQRSAFGLAAAGALLLSISPLFMTPNPVMSNYIPALQSPLFFTALLCFACGISLAALHVLLPGDDTCALPVRLSAAAFLCTITVFAITALRIPSPLQVGDYESLFWGGGHLLQFVYLLLLQWCWLVLANDAPQRPLLWILALSPSLLGVMLALLLAPQDEISRAAFTQLMRFGTPVTCLPAIAWLFLRRRLPRGIITASSALLALGLLLGLLIRDDSLLVTAHYHATNAAITLALMAIAYHLLPVLGLGTPSQRGRHFQLRLYGLGMLIYITGMASSGWLEVPRKTPMLHQQGLELLTMGMMGLGGLVAVAATLLFFFLHVAALKRPAPGSLGISLGENR